MARTVTHSPRRREAIAGLLFISPWLVGVSLFWIGPMLFSLVLSFTSYTPLGAWQWVGASNYSTIMFADPIFRQSLMVTLHTIVVYVPLTIIGSLGLALLLNRETPLTPLARAAFFLPSLTPMIAGAMIWFWIFSPRYGLANYYLESAGLPTSRWLAAPESAPYAIILVLLWLNVGGSRMMIFLAGLKDIPSHLYEAALVDGAGPIARFRYITLPMLTPLIFLNLVVAVIYSFQVFVISYSMTRGGPINSTLHYMLYLYRTAFEFFKMGYSSALAWILFVLILVFTLIQFKLSKRWVNYSKV